MAALAALETSVTGSLDRGHFGQWVFTTDVEDVSRRLDGITMERFLGPKLFLLDLEELLLQLISFLLNESYLVLEQALLLAIVLLQLSDLILQILDLLLPGLCRLCPGHHAQLPRIVNIGEALTLVQHIFLSVPQVGPRLLIIPVLPAQPCCILLELLSVARGLLLLILDRLTLGSNLRRGRIAH